MSRSNVSSERVFRAQQRDTDRIAPLPYSGRRHRAVKSDASCAEVEFTPANTALAEASSVEQVSAPRVEEVPNERSSRLPLLAGRVF
jgi:hypothetical protein